MGIYDVHSSMFTLLSGAAGDPGHGTKIARGGGWKFMMFTLLSDATGDPGHGTKIMRGGKGWDGPYFYIAKRRDPWDLTSISLFLSSKITKPDATRCHSTRDCKRCPSTSLY